MSLRISSLRPSFLIPTLAAVVVAAAMPAQAAPILIDNFTTLTGTETQTTSGVSLTPQLVRTGGSFGGFTSGNGSAVDINFSGSSRTGTVTVAGGVGTISISSDGTGSGATSATGSGGYWTYSTGTVDLTAGGNDTLRIVTGATVPSSTWLQYINVTDGTNSATLFTNSWVANTTYDIPFSTFAGVDLDKVQTLTVGLRNPAAIPGNTAYAGTLTLTSISVVPEPQSLGLLGTAGAAVAAGVFRRRRIAATR